MLKHFLEYHAEEDLEKMKFGARIIKAARTAFNRQVGESVYIQEGAARHEILNSKAKYNRCALPRLTTKMGEATVDKLEKLKKEEIEKEKELMKKIRELKMKQGRSRRERAGEMAQPAQKKRRTGKDEYKRVHRDERKPEKRNESEVKEDRDEYFPIFKKMKISEEKEVTSGRGK